jgi:hypothetical protein
MVMQPRRKRLREREREREIVKAVARVKLEGGVRALGVARKVPGSSQDMSLRDCWLIVRRKT